MSSKKFKAKDEGSAKPAVVGYYRSISEQLASEFENEEQKEIFLSNVFEQLANDINDVIFHKSTSFIVQRLLELANKEQLSSVMKIILKDFDKLIVHEVASFSVQTALYRCSHFISSDEDNVFVKHIYQAGMALLERGELVVHDKCCFIVRALLEVMAGCKLSVNSHRDGANNQLKEHEFHSEFSDILLALSSILLPTSNSLIGVVTVPHTAGTAQFVLRMLHKRFPSVCKDKCKEILRNGMLSHMNNQGLPQVLTDKTGSYFCEVFVEVLSKVPMGKLIKEVIIPHFDSLVELSHSNHVVQAAILNVKSTAQLRKVFNVLKGRFFHFLNGRQSFLIVKLLEAAVRFPTEQEEVLDSLKEEVGEDGNLIISLAVESVEYNMADDGLPQRITHMSYGSSMIAQKLLDFPDTKFICSAVANLSKEQFVSLAFSKFGSRIFDAFMSSTNVDNNSKKACASRLNPESCILLATHPIGSRVFDTLWAHLTVPEKCSVAEAMSTSFRKIFASKSGRVIAYNIQLTSFMHTRKEWDAWLIEQNKLRKKRALGEEIIGDEVKHAATSEGTPAPKKKKKKKKT